MRRVDRAIFAIFLLALVADVARAYASAPVSSEVSGSLILNAASQIQGGNSANAVFALRRAGSQLSSFEKRTHRPPVFAVWSKALLSPSVQWSQIALLQPASIFAQQSAYRTESAQLPAFSPLDRIEQAGNPAP